MSEAATAVLERLRGTVMQPLAVVAGPGALLPSRPLTGSASTSPGGPAAGWSQFRSWELPAPVRPVDGSGAVRGKVPLRLTVGDELTTPASMQPERRLMVAVLHDAVETFTRYRACTSVRGYRLFAEVAAWFAATDTTRLFSFLNVCETLGLSAGRIRSALAEWPGTYRGRARGARGGDPGGEPRLAI